MNQVLELQKLSQDQGAELQEEASITLTWTVVTVTTVGGTWSTVSNHC
jgi:hypothetical protein